MKRLYTLMVGLAAIMTITTSPDATAAAPDGYYKTAYGLSTSALKTAISNIVNPHQQVSSYSALPSYFEKTDLYPNTNQWWDMYGNVPIYLPWSGSLLNREHSLPKSWWGGLTNIPAYTDLNHLYPGEATANQKKSNWPLGEVKTVSWTNGVSTVGPGVNSGGASNVFEPADEYKGDFARTYFYMVTCYQDMNWVNTWQVRNGTYPSLQQWAIDLLLKWHRDDPVSQKEQLRNESVYDIQNNRNPFIDYPELAEYIWGNQMGQIWNPSSTPSTSNAELTAPTNKTTIDFGQVAVGKTVTRQVLVKGSDLSSANINFLITGNECAYFSIPGTTQTSSGATRYTISPTAVGSTSGTWVTVTYTPKVIGEHTTKFTITGGGLQGTVVVNARGECLAVPSLTKPSGVEATEVSDTAYVASWDMPENEVVDYWTITRNIYKGGSVTTKDDIAEANTYLVDDFADADYEIFSVRSHRLGYDSPESELVTVRHSSTAIDGIEADEPLVIESHPGFIRVRCGNPQTDLKVFDMTGRLVMALEGPVTDYFEIKLPMGVYIVTTAQHRKPVKTIAR